MFGIESCFQLKYGQGLQDKCNVPCTKCTMKFFQTDQRLGGETFDGQGKVPKNQRVKNFTLVAHYISPCFNLASLGFMWGEFMWGQIKPNIGKFLKDRKIPKLYFS